MIRLLFFAKCFLTLLSNTFAYAKPAAWPKDFIIQYPTVTVFGPDRHHSFEMMSGVYSKLFAPKDRTHFNYISLGEEWQKTIDCSDLARSHGYIHTSVDFIESEDQIRVAIPAKLQLRVKADSNKSALMLNWPILKFQILGTESNESKDFVVRNEDAFRIRDFGELISQSADSFHIESETVLLSSPFSLPKSSNYRIRMEWSADAICGEEVFHFHIGDQIRVVRSF